MKNSLKMSVAALALMVSLPGMAVAKTASHEAVAHGGHTLVTPKVATIDKTTSGSVDTTGNGVGVYTRTVTGTGADKTITTTTDFADGNDYTTTTTRDKGTNGTITADSVTDGPNGKVSSKDTTLTSTGTAGDYTISGTATGPNGKTDTYIGDKTATNYGGDVALTITNASGKTATTNTQTLKAGNATASVTTGTNFAGNAIDKASLHVNGSVAATDAVDTTIDGQGTYNVSTSTSPGMTVTTGSRSFADGTQTSNIVTASTNSNGSTTYDGSYSSVPTSGQGYSSQSISTYTGEGNGTYNISGSFNQSNGYSGTLTGTKTATAYGNATDVSYTAQGGATKTADTQQLAVGGATLNVNKDTTFSGTANDSIGLID